MSDITLLKYEGLGNDFLILIDPGRNVNFEANLATVVCDRYRGAGADGLIRLSRSTNGADISMELRNADGGIAETSGNGLRCALLAACDHGLSVSDEAEIETLSGRRHAWLVARDDVGRAKVRVTMGNAMVERRVAFDLPGRDAYGVLIGNPHLVLLGGSDDVNVIEVGPTLEGAVDGGQNVEIATTSSDRSAISIETWERGSGYTQACGSGSCAAAAAARHVGAVGDRVRVDNPGGQVTVELSGSLSYPDVVLTGEARRVCTIRIDPAYLLAGRETSDNV